MKIFKRLLAAAVLVLFLPIFTVFAEEIKYPVPTKYKYVNDYANILTDSTEEKIISIGHELYSKTKAELVVVTIESIPDKRDIETYANGLFRDWGIGDKDLNNGILLLVNTDPEDRAMRIEVGYGLEGRVPDSIAFRIQEEYILPYFRENDYDTGILKGYTALSERVAEEYNVKLSQEPSALKPETPDTRERSNLSIIILILLFLCFDGIFLKWRILRLIFNIMANSRHRGGRGGFGGGTGGFGGFGGSGGFGGFGGGSGGGFGGGSSGGGGSTGRW